MRVVSRVWASFRPLALAGSLLVLLTSSVVHAQDGEAAAPVASAGFEASRSTSRRGGDPRLDEERLRLMHETIGYTDVIDARDGHDRFDININLEYARLFDR